MDEARASLATAMTTAADDPELASYIILTHNGLAAGALRVFMAKWESADRIPAIAEGKTLPYRASAANAPVPSPIPVVSAPAPSPIPVEKKPNRLTSNQRRRNALANKQTVLLKSIQTREEMDAVRESRTSHKRVEMDAMKMRRDVDEDRMATELGNMGAEDCATGAELRLISGIVRQLIDDILYSVEKNNKFPPPGDVPPAVMTVTKLKRFTSPSTTSYYRDVGKATVGVTTKR
jgi:type IV secretory pathway VirB10-like protein